jgi:NitT/TauT family transport system substrate-binding protein
MRVYKLAIAACLAGAMLGLSGAARSAEPMKLRIGYVIPGADAPLLMFGQPGIAKHEGKTYTLDATHFQGTSPMITALAAGELDLTTFAYSSFALAVENAQMQDLRIISDIFQDGVEGYWTNEDYVLNDSEIKTVEDLKGKVLAVNVVGSAVDIALRAMLVKHHLDPKKDVTIVEVPLPGMRAELQEKKVQLIAPAPPFSYDPALRAIAHALFTQKEAIGRSQMIILVGRSAFLQKNRAVVTDYLEDELRALHWYTDPANHDAAVKLVADFSKQPVERFSGWLLSHGDFYHDPNGMPDLAALQAAISLQHQLGFLKNDLDVEKYADLDLVKDAAARIK